MHKLASTPYMDEYIIGNAKIKDELKHTLQLLNAIRAIVNGAHSGLNERGNKLRKGWWTTTCCTGEKSRKDVDERYCCNATKKFKYYFN